jgi:hypothetical protein
MTSHKIGKRIHQNISFLRQLNSCRRSKRHSVALIKEANAEQLLTLVEICFNLLKNRYPFSSAQRKRLLRYAAHIRELSRVRSVKSARRVLLQQGEGIPVIVASLLIPILGEIISKAINP